jgi:hypothetical protein
MAIMELVFLEDWLQYYVISSERILPRKIAFKKIGYEFEFI